MRIILSIGLRLGMVLYAFLFVLVRHYKGAGALLKNPGLTGPGKTKQYKTD